MPISPIMMDRAFGWFSFMNWATRTRLSVMPWRLSRRLMTPYGRLAIRPSVTIPVNAGASHRMFLPLTNSPRPSAAVYTNARALGTTYQLQIWMGAPTAYISQLSRKKSGTANEYERRFASTHAPIANAKAPHRKTKPAAHRACTVSAKY